MECTRTMPLSWQLRLRIHIQIVVIIATNWYWVILRYFSSGVAVDVDDNDILPDTTQTVADNVNVNINTSIENGENDDSDSGNDDVGWGDEGLSDDDA